MANDVSRYVTLCDSLDMLVHFPEILHVATKIQIILLKRILSHNSTSIKANNIFKTDIIAQFHVN